MGISHLSFLWIFFQIAVGYHLAMPFLLFVYVQLKQRLNKGGKDDCFSDKVRAYDYAFIVTAYEDTALLSGAVDSLLNLDYDNYLIYIVADKCDISNISFDDDRVVLLRPEEVLANNIKSHQYAIQHFKRKHDKIAIIDSDNTVDSRFSLELNQLFAKGYKAVQGLRAPSNLNTDVARLDAARDLFYHFYDGKLLFSAGSSATLAGSGMAFDTALYVSSIKDMVIQGAGFDKLLQAHIVDSGYRIGFCERAIVYDRKTTHSKQLVGQRARWINSWFKYFNLGFGLIWRGIKNTDLNQFFFGLVLLRPPLFMFLLLSGMCLTFNVVAGQSGWFYWVIGLLVFIVSFFIALGKQHADASIYRSLIKIPLFVFFQTVSLFNIRRLIRESVATKHDRRALPTNK